MGEADNTRLLQLLQISIELRDQMAEVHRLRNTLQLAENARRGKRLTDLGDVTTVSGGSILIERDRECARITEHFSDLLRSRVTLDLAASLRSSSKANT
jgi:hypothetical protein